MSATANSQYVIPFVDLAAQYRNIESEIEPAIRQVLSRCDFILGAALDDFEVAFADFVGTRFAIGVSNGFDALKMIVQALDIGPGDEVILPANTYIASALAVSFVGARPVLVDCDPLTYNIAAEQIERAITPRTKAIMPVHLTGQAADMEPILDLATRYNLPVIEDAAQAHGTVYRGRCCGALGVAGAFSFYPGKNLGAYGDGGAITTDDARLAHRLRRLRHYGQDQKYEHLEKGHNARLDTLQAAVLGVKLRHLARWNESRAINARHYREALTGVGDLQFQGRVASSSHIYHLFVVETEQRDALQAHLSAAGVQTVIHYPIPLHLQPAYAELGYRPGDFPNTERLAGRMISLPMYPELTAAQIGRVAEIVASFFGKNARGDSTIA